MKALKDKIQSLPQEIIRMKLPGMEPKSMKKLENVSDSVFDQTYLHMMIKHNQGAIKMSDFALQRLQNRNLKAMAQMMHDKQKQEITEMQQMLK